jgi:hypothetical protein
VQPLGQERKDVVVKARDIATPVGQVFEGSQLEVEVLGLSRVGQGAEVFAPLELGRGWVLDTLGKEFPRNLSGVGWVCRVDQVFCGMPDIANL